MPPDPAAVLEADRRLRALVARLVADGRNDDVAQDAWVAALQHGGSIRSLAGWLGTVARRMASRSNRGEARRARRERARAVPDELPSTADVLAREEVRSRVVEAVLALDEPLRTTIVLRFLEDQPPRVVARRMEVSVDTVQARTQRALELLRRRLDEGFGSRERRLGALLPLALPTPGALGPGSIASAMSLTTKLLASTAALALATFFLWPRDGRAGAARAGTTGAPAELAIPADLDGPIAPAPLATPAVAAARSAAEPLSEPPAAAVEPLSTARGALAVHVAWHPTPGTLADAAGFVVRVTSDADAELELRAREGTTGADGIVRFDDLPPGVARVNVDRRTGPDSRVEVVAGTTTDHEVVLRPGFAIVGRVEDEAGRPLAGAAVFLGKTTELAHAARVATSDAQGRFRLDALTFANVGARLAGRRPSAIASVMASPGAEVPLTLVLPSGGGAVHGTVTGADGEPLADALVRVGPTGAENPDLGATLDVDWGALARTDADGRFALDGLTPGTAAVVVRRAGHALARGTVEVVAGGDTALDVVLLAEPALAGHVRDVAGAPVAGATVVVGDELGPFRASARTDADGAFRVGALEDARAYVARVEDAPGAATLAFEARAGETRTWEAVLDPLGVLHGRVVDERGAPLARWVVRLRAGLDGPDHATFTGSDGRFRFENLDDLPYTVALEAPGSALTEIASRSDVHPSPDELLLCVPDARVPSVRIVGTFLDEAGRALPTAQILGWPELSTGAVVETCDPVTGRFELGPYPPGTVRLVLRADGRGAIVRERVLAAHETWDAGEIRLAPEGRLRVRLLGGEVEPDARLLLATRPGWFDPFEGDGAERLSPPLAPGDYVLQVAGGEAAACALPFTIEGGAETALDVPLRRGWRTPLALVADADVPLATLRATAADGSVVEDVFHERAGERLLATLRLVPGTYTIEAAAGPRHARGTLVVEPVDRDDPALVLALE